MEYSLSGAAKATGSSKSLIHRMCEDGRLSHRKLANGQYRIEASELGRAFSEKNHVTVLEPPLRGVEPTVRAGENDLAPSQIEISVMQARLQLIEDQLGHEREDRQRERETYQETVEDLRRRLDQEQEERRALQRQLAPPPQQAASEQPSSAPAVAEPARASRGFLARFLGL